MKIGFEFVTPQFEIATVTAPVVVPVGCHGVTDRTIHPSDPSFFTERGENDDKKYGVRDALSLGWYECEYEGWVNAIVPMLSDVCWYCGQKVTFIVDEDGFITNNRTFSVTRILGDSRYGYEPIHNRCDDRVKEEQANAFADVSCNCDCEKNGLPPCSI